MTKDTGKSQYSLRGPGRYAVAAVALVGLSSLFLVIYSNLAWESFIAEEIELSSQLTRAELLMVEGHLWLDEASADNHAIHRERFKKVFADSFRILAECEKIAARISDPELNEKLSMAEKVLQELERFTRRNWMSLVKGDDREFSRARFDSIYTVAIIQLKGAIKKADALKQTGLAQEKKILYIFVATWLLTVASVLGAISMLALKRRAAEKKLEENELRFRRLVENSRDIIYRYRLIHPRGFEYISPALAIALGESPDEYYKNPNVWLEAVNDEYRDHIENIFALRAGINEPVTIKMTGKNGVPVWMELSNSPVYNKRGDIVAVEGIARNVTRRKEVEEELIRSKEQAEQATMLKDQFVSLVSHDLRSPLGSMIGLLKIMESGGEDKGILRRAIGAGEGLLAMTDQLLNISRLKTGKIRLAKSSVDIHALIGAHASALFHTAGAKGVKVINDVPKGTRMFADFHLYGEVIANLLSNSIKFCRNGDTVRFHLPEGKFCTVAVEDTGVGVPAAILPDIFKHEVKTTTTGTNGEKGTGLGLPYCRDIMEAHGGSLTVESQVGKGTVFYAMLPKLKVAALVADADEAQRKSMAKILAELGTDIYEVATGKEALEALSEAEIHLVVAAVDLPDMKGLELLRRIKGVSGWQDIPVIAAAPSCGEELRQEAFDLGAVDFIVKPVAGEDFKPRVRRYVG